MVTKYAGHPKRHGFVQHKLGTQDITVTLWRFNDDHTRSLVLAEVDTIDDDTICVKIACFDRVGNATITNGQNFWVVVTA